MFDYVQGILFFRCELKIEDLNSPIENLELSPGFWCKDTLCQSGVLRQMAVIRVVCFVSLVLSCCAFLTSRQL